MQWDVMERGNVSVGTLCQIITRDKSKKLGLDIVLLHEHASVHWHIGINLHNLLGHFNVFIFCEM